MANSSAITEYKVLRRVVADGLSEEDVLAIKSYLSYSASTKLTSGTQLLDEMEKQDQLDEDNLETLKDVLKMHKQLKLLKTVKNFEENKTPPDKREDKLSKSWPAATFNEQPSSAESKPRTQSVTADADTHVQPMSQYQPGLQLYGQNPHGVAPPISYLGNSEMKCQGGQYQVHQQMPQQIPGVGYPMQSFNQPGQMPLQLPSQQGLPNQFGGSQSYQHGMGTPGYAPMGTGGGIQSAPQNQQELQNQIRLLEEQLKLREEQLKNSHNIACQAQFQYSGAQVPSKQPNSDPRQSSNRAQRPQSYPAFPGDPQPQECYPAPQDIPAHAKLSAVKSAPYSTSPHQDMGNLSLQSEPESGLKKPQIGQSAHRTNGIKTMNIPVDNVNDVFVKPTGPQTDKGNVVAVTSSMAGIPEPNGNNAPGIGRVTVADTNHAYQTGRVRAGSVETNTNSMTVPVPPMSSQSTNAADAELLLLSGFTGKQLYEHSKVNSFENGSYHVRIPEGVHYVTSEGAYVVLKFDSEYRIQLSNSDDRLRCSAVVHSNGRFVGDLTLDPRGSIPMERSVIDDRKFRFVEAKHAPPGSGVREDDPDNGLITVVFTPEKSTKGPWNDLTRGFGGIGGEPESDYFGTDATMAAGNDVQRSVMPPLRADWRAGATVPGGRSDQQFTPSENFQLDHSRKRIIVLRLVGKR